MFSPQQEGGKGEGRGANSVDVVFPLNESSKPNTTRERDEDKLMSEIKRHGG
jgi:hypothetical protein